MDFISKEDAAALITAEMDKIRTHSLVDGTARINLRLAKNIIEDMPGIDIVRCKECKFCLVGVATAQYSNGKQRIENLCEKHKWSVGADDYCSFGERKV